MWVVAAAETNPPAVVVIKSYAPYSSVNRKTKRPFRVFGTNKCTLGAITTTRRALKEVVAVVLGMSRGDGAWLCRYDDDYDDGGFGGGDGYDEDDGGSSGAWRGDSGWWWWRV
ncbi:hypothetical protein Tco_1529651, partial [Tanacetum coccineum]